MKNLSSVIWGILLVALGVILGGNAVGLFNIDIFFKGWWTLFIIIPSLIGLITDNDKTGSLIGLLIGVLLLLACQDVIDFALLFKLIVPIIIVIIGLSLIFKNTIGNEINKNIKELNKKNNSSDGYCSTFSSQNVKLGKEEFKGTNINAIFGGVKLDLRDATLKKDVVINASAIFGGIDILVPEGVIVKVKSSSIFGGVDNKVKSKNEKKEITIYVNATCMFGGVDIK